ncbi:MULTISPECIES: hypothetical protein [Methylomonas]|uniref:hypothetical protein n=1 Tax=Methylomonas TaxID=416 RepID=UPI0012320506|nr:hypothetical protein [Methylomonas rhizoryzae]
MVKAIVYGVLLACSLAIGLMLTGFFCWRFDIPLAADFCYAWANKLLLLGFGWMLVLGVFLVVRAIALGLFDFFDRKAVAQRQLASLTVRRQDAERQACLEKSQQHYWLQIKRSRLLAADNKKQSRQLYQSIRAEIAVMVPEAELEQAWKDLKRHKRLADTQAMLTLRQKLLCRG